MFFRDRAIIRLESVDSTNNYAANLIKLSGPPEGTVITAQFQHSGKGQRSSQWESNEGENLLCSIVLYPHFIQADNQFFLMQAIALALHETLETHTSGDVYIKWPNDIIMKGKKIAGILVEATWSDNHMNSAIVGIGVNLNQMDFEHPNAISVRNITKQIWDVDDCLMSLLHSLEKYYLKLQTGQYAEIARQYRENLYRLGQVSRFIYQDNQIDAMITGVDQQGRLRLYTAGGESLTCNMKEIGMIL